MALPAITFSRHADEDTLAGVLHSLADWTVTVTTFDGETHGDIVKVETDSRYRTEVLHLAVGGDHDNIVPIFLSEIGSVVIA